MNKLAELIAEIEMLSDDMVEDWLSPEECVSKIDVIIASRTGNASNKVKECLADLKSLQDLVRFEQSTPDVVQEYLFYIVHYFGEK